MSKPNKSLQKLFDVFGTDTTLWQAINFAFDRINYTHTLKHMLKEQTK